MSEETALDRLQTRLSEWADIEEARLEDELKWLKKIKNSISEGESWSRNQVKETDVQFAEFQNTLDTLESVDDLLK